MTGSGNPVLTTGMVEKSQLLVFTFCLDTFKGDFLGWIVGCGPGGGGDRHSFPPGYASDRIHRLPFNVLFCFTVCNNSFL